MRWPCASLGWGHFPARTFIIEVITPAFGGSTALGGRTSKPSVSIKHAAGSSNRVRRPRRAQRPRVGYASKSQRSPEPGEPRNA